LCFPSKRRTAAKPQTGAEERNRYLFTKQACLVNWIIGADGLMDGAGHLPDISIFPEELAGKYYEPDWAPASG